MQQSLVRYPSVPYEDSFLCTATIEDFRRYIFSTQRKAVHGNSQPFIEVARATEDIKVNVCQIRNVKSEAKQFINIAEKNSKVSWHVESS